MTCRSILRHRRRLRDGNAAVNDIEGSDYLTPGEAAALLHVSPKTVTRWAAEGLIPYVVTLGGHRRFRREDVNEIARRMSDGR